MAEILLSLTIIGVVAAITLPSLMANINERTWNTQRKALYARMSQAIAMMPQIGGYGTLIEGADGNVTEDTVAETFLTEGLCKVLKINNICDSEHLADCGVPATITPMSGATISLANIKTLVGFNSMFDGAAQFSTSTGTYSEGYSQTDTRAAAFETQNGESVLAYYYPKCKSMFSISSGKRLQELMCANFVYDLNGNKGPNAVGKDIGFISALYPTDSAVVAPMPIETEGAGYHSWANANKACLNSGVDSRMPALEEMAAIFYNKELVNGFNSEWYWASSLAEVGKAYQVTIRSGAFGMRDKTNGQAIRCVKR